VLIDASSADLIFLALQVILALGNRPKAERLTYTISIAVFAFFALYLIFCTVILTVKAFCPISALLADSDSTSISVFLGSTYGPIFAGIAGTFGASSSFSPHFCTSSPVFSTPSYRLLTYYGPTGTYIVSALLYLEPWHLFHSMPQYLLIAPSFTNILNVYAFCNLHDVSWGTKGSDKVEALPAVKSSKDGKEKVVEATQMVQEGEFPSIPPSMSFPFPIISLCSGSKRRKLTSFSPLPSRRHRYLVQSYGSSCRRAVRSGEGGQQPHHGRSEQDFPHSLHLLLASLQRRP
jgi:hypothetical protein